MKQRCPHFLLLLLLLLLLFLSALPFLATGASKGPLIGGWSPIKDVNDPYVKEIGEFAVTEYNKQSKSELEFQSVVKGETQVVSGENYRLVVAAKDGTATNQYEAVVWDQPWRHFRKLTSFKLIKS